MPRVFRTTLLLFLLLTVFVPPALARMTIGVSPAVTPGIGDRAILRAFEEELSSRLGEPVQVRSFDSETAQLDWLIRFREIDAALVGRSLLQTLPAGTLIRLADLPSTVAVTHPGVAAAQHETLSRAFNSLNQDDRGRKLLSRIAGAANSATAPKVEQARRAVQPLVPSQAGAIVDAPVKRSPADPKLAAAPSAPGSAPIVPAEPPPLPAAPARVPPPAVSPPATAPIKPPVAASTPAASQPAVPAAVTEPPGEPTNPKRTRLLLLAALVVLTGISVKVTLLMRHWEQKKRGSDAPPIPPPADSLEYLSDPEHPVPAPLRADRDSFQPVALQNTIADGGKSAFAFHAPEPAEVQAEPLRSSSQTGEPLPSPAEAAPKKRAASPKRKAAASRVVAAPFPPVGDELVIEQGRLGRIKVPAVLKRCAELPQPVVLRVRSGDSETCVHFAGGQICHAYSHNWKIDNGARQSSKLSYLMVRDGLISESQRDQALELIERQPELRFAAALRQLGALDLEALRHILTRQAKTVVFALILFSAGEYRVETDNGAIPAEESIATQVEALIREASHHQAEWTAIRKVLPTPGTLLDFAPDGHEKLDQVRLSVHQQLLLSQVDGRTPISTLCSVSTMMDYEVSRFLYLMVKAGVLQVVTAA